MNKNDIEFVVHIGAGKTGSTAIQSYLKSNFDELKKSSILYAGLVFETLNVDKEWKNDPWIFSDEVPSEKLIQEADIYAKYAIEHNLTKVVISNESFCNRIDLLIPFLQYLRKNYTLKIVYYVRDLLKWTVSAYKQWNIKHKTYQGRIDSFYSYLNTKPYKLLANITEELVRSGFKDVLTIRNFDKLKQGDITFDFLSAIGGIADKGPRSNEGLTIYDMPIFYFYNNSQDSPTLPNKGNEILKEVNTYTELSNDYLKKVKLEVELGDIAQDLSLTSEIINQYLDEKDLLSCDFAPIKSVYPDIAYLNMTQFALDNYTKLKSVDAIKLRDAAILLEDDNLQLSYSLMKSAHALRPTGEYIKNKLNEYESRLNS